MVGKGSECSRTKDADLLCGCVLHFKIKGTILCAWFLFHARSFIAILGVHGSSIVKQSASAPL